MTLIGAAIGAGIALVVAWLNRIWSTRAAERKRREQVEDGVEEQAHELRTWQRSERRSLYGKFLAAHTSVAHALARMRGGDASVDRQQIDLLLRGFLRLRFEIELVGDSRVASAAHRLVEWYAKDADRAVNGSLSEGDSGLLERHVVDAMREEITPGGVARSDAGQRKV